VTRRDHLALTLLACLALFAPNPGDAMADPLPELAATDSVEELEVKLQSALAGVALDQLEPVLSSMGARNIGITLDDDPSEPAPVMAIFGLRRGFLRNDRRVQVFIGMDAAQRLGPVTSVETFAK
jgi:hypothetical protein